jgi:hypothetical protein
MADTDGPQLIINGEDVPQEETPFFGMSSGPFPYL